MGSNLRKLLCLIMIMVLIVLQVGCVYLARTENDPTEKQQGAAASSVDTTTASDSAETEVSSTGEDQKLRIGYSMGSGVGPEYEALKMSIINAAGQAQIELEVYDAGSSLETAFADIRNMISEDYDAIGVLPISIDDYEAVLEEADEAGIPVVMFDRPAGKADLYDAVIASDFYQQGVLAAEWLINTGDSLGLSSDDESVNVLILHGGFEIGLDQSDKRYQGFVDTLAPADRFVIAEELDGGFYFEQAQSVVAELLAQGKQIDVVFACNDSMALGAAASIEAAGKKPGEDIIIIGVDASPAAIDLIGSGKMNCTIESERRLGELFIKYVLDSVAGEKTVREIFPQEEAIDASNLETADIWVEQLS